MVNGRIDKYQFEEGYCQAEKSSSDKNKDIFTFYYYDQDHLGNIRQVRKVNGSKGEVIQTNNYYPFGAEFCDNGTKNYTQKHKYNGKEFDNMHGLNSYDYGARQYNPVTARWDRVDPLCEKYYSTSPYVYCVNNPVRFIDPDGKKTVLFATTLPGYPDPQTIEDKVTNFIVHDTPVGWATHTFIAVFNDKTNAQIGYFAFGPTKNGLDNPLYLKDWHLLSDGKSHDAYPQDEDVINNYINGVKDENLKVAIEISIPKGMSSEQFDKKVISTGKSYKPESTTRYLLYPSEDFTANCNKGSYNLLKQSGVGKDYLKTIGSKLPGITWGWGQDMPWTKEEQKKAWNDYINQYTTGND